MTKKGSRVMGRNKLLTLMIVMTAVLMSGCKSNNDSSKPSSFEDVSTIDVDEMYANEVIELIESLNENSTTQDVEYILGKYNDLTERQKTFVYNFYKLEIFGKALLINEKIEQFSIDNLSIDEFLKFIKEYKALIEKYGDEAKNKIKQSNLDKIVDLELAALNILLDSENGNNLENNAKIAMFSLLIPHIDNFYNELKDLKKDQIINYDSYLEKKNSIIDLSGFLYDGDYSLHYVYEGKIFENEFLPRFDNNLGYMHEIEFPKGGSNAEVDFDCLGEDWSNYDSFGLFIRFNNSIGDRCVLIPNNNWDNAVYADPVLVDGSSHLYFYKISLDTIDKPFDTSIDKRTYFQVYFGNTNITSMSISNLVYFNKDYTEINEMIAKANSLNLSSDSNLTQFVLLSEKIDALISPKDADKVSNYDNYLSKKERALAKTSIVHNSIFTTSYNGEYPAFSKTDSNEFGYINSLYLSGGITNHVQIFADGAKDKDWSMFDKISMFVELDTQISDSPWLIINYDEESKQIGSQEMYSESNNIYYFEFTLDTDSAFTGNPFVSIFITNKLYNVKVTNWVGIKYGQ